MQTLVYEGPHAEVEIDHESGSWIAERGKPVEVPDDVAADLLTHGEDSGDQPQHARTWRKATAKESAKTVDKDNAAEGGEQS